MKECSKCRQLLELSKFSKQKGKYVASCNPCRYQIYLIPWKERNGKIKQPKTLLSQEERDIRSKQSKAKYHQSEQGKQKSLEYRTKNKGIINKKKRESRAAKSLGKVNPVKLTPEQKKEKQRQWYLSNRKLKPRELKVSSNKPLAKAIRRRFEKALKGNKKQGKMVDLLGCTIPELKIYLESLFLEGMTWENRSEWHIDHIKPLCSFDLSKHEEQTKACHYTNLRPLWAKDNLNKAKEDVKLRFISDI